MTVQIEEKIIINEEKFTLLSRPFEPFLKALDVNLLPLRGTFRGYIGEWTIENNVLYLSGIKLRYRAEDEDKLAPLKIDGVIYQATWYSGDLRVPLVKPIYYHSSYQPVYTKEMHLKVKEGLIVNHKIVENEVPNIEEDNLPF